MNVCSRSGTGQPGKRRLHSHGITVNGNNSFAGTGRIIYGNFDGAR